MPIKKISIEQKDLIDLRARIRHSAAHVMADAVLALFPDAQFAVGPSTDDGFYYDFAVERPFTPEDLEKIEKHMLHTIQQSIAFKYSEISRAEAIKYFSNQEFKLQIIDSIPVDQTISTYSHGDFVDLCQRHLVVE